MRSIGIFFLAAYLIFIGLSGLFNLKFEGEPTVLGLLAIAAGVLLLVGAVDWFALKRTGG